MVCTVWALAACSSISTEAEHIGYIIGDLLAKFLLNFVYIASIDEQIMVRRLPPSRPPAACAETSGSEASPTVSRVVVGRPVILE